MIRIKNMTDNVNHVIIEKKGRFMVLEHKQDCSVNPEFAEREFFLKEMNIRRHQLIAKMDGKTGVVIQAGAMQWMAGGIQATTGLKNPLDLIGKFAKSKMTNETVIKPEYQGEGTLVMEPTYKHILLENVEDWEGGLVMEDGMFIACDATVNRKVQMRKTVSSAVLGDEGMFNTKLTGTGICALESNVPREELVVVELDNDVLKIDGSYAICWSGDLEFIVSRAGKTLVGSYMSKEKLVNTYRGTGKVLLSPIANSDLDVIPEGMIDVDRKPAMPPEPME